MEAELIVSCPYNPAHRIRKCKFNDHVAKCKKSTVVVNKTTCPLNSSHIVDSDQIREHLASCDGLGKLVQDQNVTQNQRVNQKEDSLPDDLVNSYLPDEDWNNEPEVPSYNPMANSAERLVMRSVSGLSKAERKKFREKERMRIASLKEIGTSRPFLPSSPSSENAQESWCLPHNIALPSPKRNTRSNKTAEASGFNTDLRNKLTGQFQRTLHDELVSECDNTSTGVKHSLDRSDTDISVRNNSQRGNSENLLSVQKGKMGTEKVEEHATYRMHRLKNAMKEKSTCVGSASNIETAVLYDQNSKKLPILLKNHSDTTKIGSTTNTRKINDEETDEDLTWEEVFSTFNERLSHLTDIQNTAAEESARLLKQLKDLQLHQETISKK